MNFDGVQIKHINNGMSVTIDSNSEDAPEKEFDFNGTSEQSIINLSSIQNSDSEPSHEIEEDMSKTIKRIVDIAKEILLITERNLPMDRK